MPGGLTGWSFALLMAAPAAMFLCPWSRSAALGLGASLFLASVGLLVYAGHQQHRDYLANVARWSARGSPRGDAWRRLLVAEDFRDIVDVGLRVRDAVRISTTAVEDVPR